MSFGPHPALQRRPVANELCQLLADYRVDLPAMEGMICEEKIDGWRMLRINGELVSRQGSPLSGIDHISAELDRLEQHLGLEIFVDGEIQIGGSLDATREHFQSRGRNGNAGVLSVFDVLPMSVWRGDVSSEPLTARRSMLDALAGVLDPEIVRIVPWTILETTTEIEEFARDVIGGGGEGLVIKCPNSTYERRRTSTWLKIKTQHLATPVPTARPILRPRFGIGATA